MTAPFLDNLSRQKTARRTKQRGLLLALIGYALAIGLLWLCRLMALSTVTVEVLLRCAILFAVNSAILLLLVTTRGDRWLKFDPHFIYTPVVTSIVCLTYYLYVAGEARGILFAVIFMPYVFMVSLVGLRDGLVLSSLYVIFYLTMLLYINLKATEVLDTQAEGVRVTVFFLVSFFTCFVMDRTKRQRERHIGTLKEVAVLQEMGKTLVSTLVVDRLVNQILSIIREKFGSVNCSLFTVEKDAQELVLRAQKGFVQSEKSKPVRLRLSGLGVTVWVANHGEMANVPDVRRDSRYIDADLASEKPIASELALPLKRQGEVFGVLDIQSERVNGFDANDERVLTALADYASIALANARWVDEIHDRANRDGLTGLYNHRFLLEQVEIELHRADRLGYSCAFIMADIDHFKLVNDTFGHQNGDAILTQVSRTMAGSLRSIDILGRYGGEEFGVILLNVSLADALVVAEKIRLKIRETMFLDVDQNPRLQVTASFGVALFPDDARAPSDLIRVADERLYQAKLNGRNLVFPVSPRPVATR